MMKHPKPIIAAYLIRRLKFTVENNKVVASWATRAPEIINTLDVEELIKEPNTFILGWQEIHYELKTESIKGTIVERYVETYIDKEHTINVGIVSRLGQQLLELQANTGLVQIPVPRSYEKILFDLGWKKFVWQATGTDDMIGAVIPDEIIAQLPEQPELKPFLDGSTPLVDYVRPQPVPQPVVPHVAPSAKSSELDELKLIVGNLASAVAVLTSEVRDAKTNSFRSDESRLTGLEREENLGNHFADAGPAPVSIPQHGGAVSELEGKL